MDVIVMLAFGVAAYLAWKNWDTVKVWFGLGDK